MKRFGAAMIEVLPATGDSLARAAADKIAGTLYVRTAEGSLRIRPEAVEPLLFGRNRNAVHICLGGDDRNVSRVQGSVTFHDRTWWLQNRGRRRLQLPRGLELASGSDEWPLPPGHTVVFLRTNAIRVHILELYVSEGTVGE